MATKRTSLRRGMRLQITPEMVELWKRAREDRDEERRSEHSRELHRLIGWKPWEPFLEWVTSPEPPAYRTGDEQYAAMWQKAWELRQELEAAA